MAFHPANENLKERILVMGGAGAGKSYDWLSIAKRSQTSGSDAVFYCLDTDMAIDRMLGTEFADLTNVVNTPVFDWQTFTKNFDEIQKKVKPNDWVIIDLLSPTWDMVQEYFTEQVFNKGIEDFFLEARKVDKSKQGASAFEGWKDWPVINKLYRDLMNKILRNPCHVYCTTVAKALNRDQADKETISIYGPHGVMPAGQKHTGHFFHTTLWKKQVRDGWVVVTVKDRGRKYQEGTSVSDFSTSYLMAVAGWRP